MAVQRLGPHPRPLRDRGLSVLSSGRVGSRSQGLSLLGAAPGPGITQRGRTEPDFTPEPSPPAGRLSLEIEGVCRAQRSSVGDASPLTMTQSPPGRSIHLFLASQLSLSLSAAFSPAAFPQSCCIFVLPLNFSLIASF